MRAPRWYLGVDGGGTKTAAVILDDRGRKRAFAEGKASLRTETGWLGVARTIRATVATAERRAGIRPRYTAACFAIAGVDAPQDARAGKRALVRVFGRRVQRTLVVNDTAAALRAGTPERFAAVVVAGTGSNAFARGPKGTAFAGGWGLLLGDDGGGYWIARAALRAALKSLDGRGPETALWPALAHASHARTLRQLHELLVRSRYAKRTVSLLSRTVDQVSRRDTVARAVLVEAADRLATMAAAAARRAGLGQTPFPLVASGGCFAAPVLLRSFRSILRQVLPGARVVVLRIAPAVGAARLAVESSTP